MSRTDPQFNLRIPEALRDKVMEASKENKRSATAEILARLESTFVRDEHSDGVRQGGELDDAPGHLDRTPNGRNNSDHESEIIRNELTRFLDKKLSQMEERLTLVLDVKKKPIPRK